MLFAKYNPSYEELEEERNAARREAEWKSRRSGRPNTDKKKTLKTLVRFLAKLAVLGIAIWYITTHVAALRIIHSNEMYPNIKDGDFVLFQRTEDVVFDDVVLYNRGSEEHAGRIIGIGGDTIEVNDQGLLVNGSFIYNYVPYDTKPDGDRVKYPLVLNDDEFFILADLRTEAKDSRTYGPVKRSDLLGKEIFSMRRRGF